MEKASYIGGFIMWLLCGCKTKLYNEVHGRGDDIDFKWFRLSRGTVNFIIGFIAGPTIPFICFVIAYKCGWIKI